MQEIENFISQSLSPAFVLSAIAVQTVGLHNRMLVISQRIREMNREAYGGCADVRRENIRRQVRLLMERINHSRTALFQLYGAMALMVLTALNIALHELGYTFPGPAATAWIFLGGLFLILSSVATEAFSVAINLKTLEMDVEVCLGEEN